MALAELESEPGKLSRSTMLPPPPLHSTACPLLLPTICPALLISLGRLFAPKSIMPPSLHSTPCSTSLTSLTPSTCPASLIANARLDVKSGRPPRSMTLPLLHSIARGLPLILLCPTTCPRSLTPKAASPSRWITPPPLHSTAPPASVPPPARHCLWRWLGYPLRGL